MAPKKRNLEAIQENTRQRMKLRSPSLLKQPEGYSPEPIAKRGKHQANPKSTAAGSRARTPPPSPPHAQNRQPIIPPEARPTERLKAIINGMKEGRMKEVNKNPSPKKRVAEPPNSTPKKQLVDPYTREIRRSPRRPVNAIPSTVAFEPQLPSIPESVLPTPTRPVLPARSTSPSLSDIPSELIPSVSSSVQPTQSTNSGSQVPPAGQAINSQPPSLPELPEDPVPEPPELGQEAPTVVNVAFECPEGDIEVPENPRSIRCKPKANTGDKPVRRTRGVVNGHKVANYVRSLGSKIKVEHGPEHGGPRNRHLRSMLTHEIGSCVRDKVPMLAPSYGELEPEHWAIVFDHLTPNFVLDFDDTWIWRFITRIATERYRDWKSDCQVHYEKFGAELPLEFVDRKEQWRWLVGHFREPKVQARGKKMKEVRNAPGRTNHHSGKFPFSHRAEKHALSNDKAPFITAYGEVYGADARGAEIAEQMRQRVREMTTLDHDSEDPGVIDDPLPISTQIEIITQIVGHKRGTQISGIGKSLEREPLPRGGARVASDTIQLTVELKKTQENMEKQFEERMADQARKFMDQIRMLEEMIKGGAGVMASNASDGATSNLALACKG